MKTNEENNKIRKNLKFSKEKKEQYNAAIFLSKIEREQTAFVSFLINQYLLLQGIRDAEEVTKEDAMMLFQSLKSDYEKGRLREITPALMDIDSIVSNPNMQKMIEQCVKNVIKNNEYIMSLDSPIIEKLEISLSDDNSKKTSDLENDNGPSRTIIKETEELKEHDESDEEDSFEINNDLIGGLGMFF